MPIDFGLYKNNQELSYFISTLYQGRIKYSNIFKITYETTAKLSLSIHWGVVITTPLGVMSGKVEGLKQVDVFEKVNNNATYESSLIYK